MKKLFFGLACLSFMTACQNDEVVSNEVAESVKMEAEVSSSGALFASRTATTTEGKVTFSENDCVGFYMPDASLSGKWTLKDGEWVSDISYSWTDKVNDYSFAAYYPFTIAASRTAIPMPNLSEQKGEVDDLSDYDFLVAHCTTNYKANAGTVSFTDDHAFKHAYALVSITVKKDKESENVVLSDMSLKADDLFSSHTYNMGELEEEDVMEAVDESVNELNLNNMSATVPAEGLNKLFIVNPVALHSNAVFTIKYTRDDIKYTASTEALGSNFAQGSLYKLTVKLKKSGLEVVGNTVEDWVVNDLEDANVEEIPVDE